MPADKRDRDIIEHILRYCDQIDAAHADFGCSQERFVESSTYQNAISMCILQIGELVNRLSEDFKAAHAQIPWHKIRGMRNYVAHEYGTIDFDVVWFVATNSVRELKRFCAEFLAQNATKE